MGSKKVFLGGTRNDSSWREQLIPILAIDSYNPVVKDWTPQCQFEEIKQRKTCDYVLYVITPEMKGVYSIAEVVEDSVKRPRKTVLGLLREANGLRFDDAQWESLLAVAKMVVANGGVCFYTLEDIATYLNTPKNVEVRSATGVEGHLLYCHATGTYLFREYNSVGGFIDYDIKHSDLLVKITDADASFYAVNDSHILDHCPATLGV